MPSPLPRKLGKHLCVVYRFAGDGAPATLARAEEVYQGVAATIRNGIYEQYGALELMSVLLAQRYEHGKGNWCASGLFWANAVK